MSFDRAANWLKSKRDNYSTSRHLWAAINYVIDLLHMGPAGSPIDSVLDEIGAERERQIAKGYDAAHDDQHVPGDIDSAAGLILMEDIDLLVNDGHADNIAGHVLDKHEDDRRRQLVIAAALIVAEIERMDRTVKS